MNLSYFNQTNLHTAGVRFFEQTGIKLATRTENPLTKEDVFTGDLAAFNQTEDAQHIDQIFWLGLVTNETLQQKTQHMFAYEATALTFETAKTINNKNDKYDALNIFAVALKPDTKPTRTQLAAITRAFNRASKAMPVAVLYKYGNYAALAASRRVEYKQKWRPGEKIGKVAILRDIDLAENAIHTGHARILDDLKSESERSDCFEQLYKNWQKVFDLSLLNRKFYQALKQWYDEAKKNADFAKTELINKLESKAKKITSTQNQATKAEIEANIARLKAVDHDTHTSVELIRLITRIIFAWFLKEKKLVPDALFDHEKIKTLLKDTHSESVTYFKAVLQNLFFACFNMPEKDRRWHKNEPNNYNNPDYGSDFYRYPHLFTNPKQAETLFGKIPFLNGGLFDKLPDDWFSATTEDRPVLPNKLFFGDPNNPNLTGLIPLLAGYKFTVEENTPLEQDVALDPELLGKIFEELLASYNPEARKNARNETGSFYTPREIVEYMTDQSLKAYFAQKLQSIPEATLPTDSSQAQTQPTKTLTLTPNEQNQLDDKLNDLLGYAS